jgi:hypothetical protein
MAAAFAGAHTGVWACSANQAKPFNAGPLDAQGMFSSWVVDMNGVGLQACTDSLTNDGNPPPCFYDPVVPGNALSAALGRGNEAFMFLADSVFTTPGTAPIDAVIVMGVETAFLSAEPAAGFQTQFQRFRTRLNVAAVGIYTVESPWGKSIYRVDTLLPPGNGQNRAEVSEPIDLTFNPNSTVPGLVSPFLIADNKGGLDPNVYIGDGLTPTTVTGSPCGTNFIKITATGLDGVTPIPINNVAPTNVYTSNLFTVMGKLAPVAPVPLSIGAAYYTRNAGSDTVTVMVDGSTSSTQQATMTVTVNGVANPMAKDVNHFYGTVPAPVTLPQQISVTASDPGRPSIPNTQSAPLKDLVTISLAEASCTGSGATKACTLTVNASSSDDGSSGVTPMLTLQHSATPLVNGAAAVTSAAVPAYVTVSSSAGGAAVRAVTLK